MSNVDSGRLIFQTDGVCVSIGEVDENAEYDTVDSETFRENDKLFSFANGELSLGNTDQWKTVEREQQIKEIKENIDDIIAKKEIYMLTDERVTELNDFVDSLDPTKELPSYPLIYRLAKNYYEDKK